MSTYLCVLRHRDFRLFFLGQSASMVGDRVVVVAIALFVTQTTGSPTDLSLVLAAQTLPLVALLLIGGVWADRLPRNRIMIATDLVRAGLHALLVGAWEAFAFDACTFVVSALLLARVRPRPRGEASDSGRVLTQLRKGFREVRSRTWVWATIAGFSGAVLFVYAPWYALAPSIARDTYGS